MIKWCSYCFHFIGEIEPWDDFQISHGVCKDCYQKTLNSIVIDNDRVSELRRFFQTMRLNARSGSFSDVTAIFEESHRLRIPPMDLIIGMLQPLLVEIGALWESGQVTVATEHRFSALVVDLLSLIRRGSRRDAAPGDPELILVNSIGNSHDIGLQIAELYFASIGLPTFVALSSHSVREVFDLLNLYRPKAVGFSLALPSQMAHVREISERIEEVTDPPKTIFVGGPAVRMGLRIDPSLGIQVCRDLMDVLPLLGKSIPNHT